MADQEKPKKWWERTWLPMVTFEDWQGRWAAVETFEEAAGLVHVLVEGARHDDPRAVRMLLGFTDLGESDDWRFGGGDGEAIKRICKQATKALLDRFLKDGNGEFEEPPWCLPFEQDSTLLATMLAELNRLRGSIRENPGRDIVRAFLARWAGLMREGSLRSHSWGLDDGERVVRLHEIREANLEAIYRLCFQLGFEDMVFDHGEASLTALRALAFEASGYPTPAAPRDLAEALIWRGGGLNSHNREAARRLAVLEEKARGLARQKQEEEAVRLARHIALVEEQLGTARARAESAGVGAQVVVVGLEEQLAGLRREQSGTATS